MDRRREGGGDAWRERDRIPPIAGRQPGIGNMGAHYGVIAKRHDHERPVARIRERCIFTTHTPVEAGHDQFAYDLVERELGSTVDMRALRRFGGSEQLNMTHLALNLSEIGRASCRERVCQYV